MKQFKGLFSAPFTGFDGNGNVDIAKVAEQQKYYKDNGIAGVFACGTTGEGSALSLEERKSLLKEWAKYRDENFAVIGFLGGTNVREAAELAAFSAEIGLDAVAMTAPYYQKCANLHELALTLAEVASAAPDMPFFYYHIPCLTNVNYPMFELLKEMDAVIPNLAGIKYTFENVMDFQLCLEYKDRKYNIMFGRDEMLLPALAVGAQAFIGSTYGYHAPVYTEIIKAFNEGDMKKAAALQYEANKMIYILNKYGNGAGKAFMKAADMDLGPCRRPLTTLTDEQYKAMLKDLESTRFEEFKNKRY